MTGGVVLVTGSSGLIGSGVIRALAGRYRLVGFDREGPPHPPPEAHCIDIDLTSDRAVSEAFDAVRRTYGTRIASVIHLAAFYDFKGDPSPKYREVTIEGTERLLRELRRFEVEQLLFSSTLLVHAASRERIDERSPLAPAWAYPRSKVLTEELLRTSHGSIPLVILRIAGVYDDWGRSIPIAQQIRRIAEGRLTSRFYPGDLDVGQSFVHLEDTVDAIVRCVDRRASLPAETTLLVGEPETLGYGELQAAIGVALDGRPRRTWRIPKPLAKLGAWLQARTGIGGEEFIRPWMIDRADDHYAIDVSRARRLLGWQPRHRLRDELPRIVANLVRDPARWYRVNRFEEPPRRLRTRFAHA